MRIRLFSLLLLTLMALGGLPALAASPETLTTLASYFPADTVVFTAVRTDDDFIGTLDALAQRVGRVIPEAAPPVSLSFLLNVASMESLGVGFEAGVRSWLGDTAAFGLLSIQELIDFDDEAPGVLLAAEVTNRTAALDFLEIVLANAGTFEKSRSRRYNVFYSARESLAIAVGDDVLLVSTNIDDLALDGDFIRLSADDTFNAALAGLPAPDYNALLYLNTPALQAANLEMMRSMGMESPLFDLSADIAGVSVVGFTLLDDRSLTIDAVSQINLDSMSGFGVEMFFPAPVDPAFAQRVPADAPFVLLGSDVGQMTASGLDNLRRLDAFVMENGGWAEIFGSGIDFRTRASLENFSLSAVLGGVNLTFAGLTGLSLENEALPMLSGNFALFARAITDESLGVIPDIGFVSEIGDAELAFANAAQLRASLDAYGTDYSVEPLSDAAEVVALHWLRSLLQTDSPNVDIVFGTDGFSFAAGTRRAVLDARDSLSNDPAYLAAQAYFLPDSPQIAYIGGRALVNLVDLLLADRRLSFRTISDLTEMRPILTGIESASVTGAYVGDDTAVARFVLTLADLPPASTAGQSGAAPSDAGAPPPGAAVTSIPATPSGSGDLPPGIVTPTPSP